MRSGLFANLREMTARQQSSLSRLCRQWNQSFLLFFFSRLFFFLSFFSLSVERPKLTPGRRKYGATAEKRNQDNSITAPTERMGYHLKERELNV